MDPHLSGPLPGQIPLPTSDAAPPAPSSTTPQTETATKTSRRGLDVLPTASGGRPSAIKFNISAEEMAKLLLPEDEISVDEHGFIDSAVKDAQKMGTSAAPAENRLPTAPPQPSSSDATNNTSSLIPLSEAINSKATKNPLSKIKSLLHGKSSSVPVSREKTSPALIDEKIKLLEAEKKNISLETDQITKIDEKIKLLEKIKTYIENPTRDNFYTIVNARAVENKELREFARTELSDVIALHTSSITDKKITAALIAMHELKLDNPDLIRPNQMLFSYYRTAFETAALENKDTDQNKDVAANLAAFSVKFKDRLDPENKLKGLEGPARTLQKQYPPSLLPKLPKP